MYIEKYWKSIYNSMFIHIIINIKEDMKLKYTTKVQSVSGSLTTSIPKIIRDFLELEKGNEIEWELDFNTQEIKIRKLE